MNPRNDLPMSQDRIHGAAADPQPENVGHENVPRPPKDERQRHTPQQWEEQRAFIAKLLIQHTHKDVIRILWEERKFKIRYGNIFCTECVYLQLLLKFTTIRVQDQGLGSGYKSQSFGL